MANEAEELWGRTLASVRERIGSGARAWVEGTKPLRFTDDTMVLGAPSAFAKEWLESRYSTMLSDALRTAAGREVHLQVTVEAPQEGIAEAADLPEATPEQSPAERPRNELAPAQLSERYTFDTFVVGPSNSFPHAAAQAVAEQPARSYNPLFIYGGAGLGKTHLLHAIGHEVNRLYPHAQVRYVSSERFMNEFILGVREERMPAFRRRYREADVLLVDDIQFMARGEQTQEEFFHTFNALHNDGRQIVITSDRAPAEIPRLEERLRTRFEWGLMTDVRPPDLETRVAILQKKAAAEGFSVPNDVLSYIAENVQNNIRELEGRLVRVVAFASLSQSELTIELAQEVLRPFVRDGAAGQVPVELIILECVAYYGVAREELVGPARSRPLVHARQVAMYLCRELTPMSLPKIGDAFHRDHTTVIHALDKIRTQISERRQVYTQVQELTARVRTKANRAL